MTPMNAARPARPWLSPGWWIAVIHLAGQVWYWLIWIRPREQWRRIAGPPFMTYQEMIHVDDLAWQMALDVGGMTALLCWVMRQAGAPQAPGVRANWFRSVIAIILWAGVIGCSRHALTWAGAVIVSACLIPDPVWRRRLVWAVPVNLIGALLMPDISCGHTRPGEIDYWTLQTSTHETLRHTWHWQHDLVMKALEHIQLLGHVTAQVMPVPQAYGEYAVIWLLIHSGWIPTLLVIFTIMGLMVASWWRARSPFIRSAGNTSDTHLHFHRRAWRLVSAWLLFQAVVALGCNLGWLMVHVGVGFPGLSAHPLSAGWVGWWLYLGWRSGWGADAPATALQGDIKEESAHVEP